MTQNLQCNHFAEKSPQAHFSSEAGLDFERDFFKLLETYFFLTSGNIFNQDLDIETEKEKTGH